MIGKFTIGSAKFFTIPGAGYVNQMFRIVCMFLSPSEVEKRFQKEIAANNRLQILVKKIYAGDYADQEEYWKLEHEKEECEEAIITGPLNDYFSKINCVKMYGGTIYYYDADDTGIQSLVRRIKSSVCEALEDEHFDTYCKEVSKALEKEITEMQENGLLRKRVYPRYHICFAVRNRIEYDRDPNDIRTIAEHCGIQRVHDFLIRLRGSCSDDEEFFKFAVKILKIDAETAEEMSVKNLMDLREGYVMFECVYIIPSASEFYLNLGPLAANLRTRFHITADDEEIAEYIDFKTQYQPLLLCTVKDIIREFGKECIG